MYHIYVIALLYISSSQFICNSSLQAIEAGCSLVHPNAQNDNNYHQISERGAAPIARIGGGVSPCDEQLKNAAPSNKLAHSDQHPYGKLPLILPPLLHLAVLMVPAISFFLDRTTVLYHYYLSK